MAAGLSPLDIGSDVGGSILEPAHYCGIFGLRPTEHRVSSAGMVLLEPVPVWNILMALGPMARSARDVHLAMQVISGSEGRDYNVPPLPWRQAPKLAMQDLRIAWASTLGSAVAPDIRDAVERLVQELGRMGAQVAERLPAVDLAEHVRLFDVLFGQVVGAFGPRPDGAPPVALADYFLALNRRTEIIAAWEAFFADWDALLCPIRAVTAPRNADRDAPLSIDGRPIPEEESAIPPLLAPISAHPAIVLPVGRDRAGLPIGVQLIGRRWDDERLIAIAELLTAVTDGYQPPPGY
ncbi:MAG: amidase family protein [Chloroflexota bacterium]|nr:amidase family protein [Chloroflexota bacterium]